MIYKQAVLTIASVMALTSSPAIAAVFDVNQSGNGVSAVGTITTDDTLGVLGQANITDFMFNLNDGVSTFTLDGFSNSQLLLNGTSLTATATGLFFNFSGNGFALFQNPTIGSGMNFVCFTGNSVCGGSSNRVSVSASQFGGGFAQQGVQQIGTLAGAVPEPATWAMMLLGFGFIGGAMRSAKRRHKVTVSYA